MRFTFNSCRKHNRDQIKRFVFTCRSVAQRFWLRTFFRFIFTQKHLSMSACLTIRSFPALIPQCRVVEGDRMEKGSELCWTSLTFPAITCGLLIIRFCSLSRWTFHQFKIIFCRFFARCYRVSWKSSLLWNWKIRCDKLLTWLGLMYSATHLLFCFAAALQAEIRAMRWAVLC